MAAGAEITPGLSPQVGVWVKGFHDEAGKGCGRAGDQHSSGIADAGADGPALS